MLLTPPTTPNIAVSFAELPDRWRQFPAVGGALATSWRYQPGPAGWAPAMPRNGIVVHVFFVRDSPAFPPLRLRLPAKPRFTLEGAPNTREYRIHGRILGHNVEIWVDVRNAHPSSAQIRVAQRVVSSVRFR